MELEVERHKVIHVPFRSWCPACVSGKARGRLHKRRHEDEPKRVSEVVFDYAFLGSEGGEPTILVLVARDRRTQMIFAHVVPRKGLSHEHGAKELEADIKKPGYREVLLNCDGEPALKCVQEEVMLVAQMYPTPTDFGSEHFRKLARDLRSNHTGLDQSSSSGRSASFQRRRFCPA